MSVTIFSPQFGEKMIWRRTVIKSKKISDCVEMHIYLCASHLGELGFLLENVFKIMLGIQWFVVSIYRLEKRNIMQFNDRRHRERT